MASTLGMTVDLYMAYHYAHARFADLDLYADTKGKKESTLNATKQAIGIKFPTGRGLIFFYVTLTLQTFIRLDTLGFLLLLGFITRGEGGGGCVGVY